MLQIKIFGVDYSGRVIELKIDDDVYRVWMRKDKHKYIIDVVFKNGLDVDFEGEELTDLSISNILKSVLWDIKRLSKKVFSN